MMIYQTRLSKQGGRRYPQLGVSSLAQYLPNDGTSTTLVVSSQNEGVHLDLPAFGTNAAPIIFGDWGG